MLATIPQELIEYILVIAAKDGYPSTVSSLSQTCKHFYHFLSLRSDNRHLWHDLFLAVFDDPHLGELEGNFDWRMEYLNRMQAQRSFKRWTTSRAMAKNKGNDGKAGKGKQYKSIKDTKDAHEQEKRLLQSLRTLLKAMLIENPPMVPDLSSSSSSSSSASSVDSDDFDNMMLFGAPLSDTHLTHPLLIVLHALTSQHRARGLPSPYLHADEKWAMQLLDSVKSTTSAWAEGVLENGYPNVLKERLLTFDAWVHRRPKSKRRRASPNDIVPTIPPFLLSPSTNADIVSNPDWELTETGRLFYKLVMMKGYLFDRPDRSAIKHHGTSRRTLSEQKRAARILARRRVYDMKYLTGERLFGPYLPVGNTLGYGLPELEETQDDTSSNIVEVKSSADRGDGTTNDSSYYPSSSHSSASSSTSSSDDEGEGELDVFHTDMLHLITAGIHPHYLIHHHLFHHPLSDDEDPEDDVAHGVATNGGANDLAGGSGGHSQSHQGQSQTPGSQTSSNGNDANGLRSDNVDGTGRAEDTKNQRSIDPLILAEIAPHKVVPDYAFLSAARLLIEMNMKDAWSNLISTGQPDGGDDDEEEYDGSGIDDDDDEDEEESEENEEGETNRRDHGAEEETTTTIDTNEAPIATHNSSNLSSIAIMPDLQSLSSSSPSASSTLSSSGSHSQLSNFQSSESPATNNTSVNQNINNTGQEGGHDNGDDDNLHGNGDANSAEMVASLMARITRDTRRWVERLVDAFSALDFVRMGGAVGYWKNVGRDVRDWRRNNRKEDVGERRAMKDKEEERLTGKGKGKGKARAKDGLEEYEGWDWAGVEGEWRRVVCWMDYQDLLLHSSGATRINPNFETDEAIRLFPHKLHITGYSPPPAFPPSPLSSPSSSCPALIDGCRDETTNPDALIWHLPVIHFAGESRLLESAGNGHWNGQSGGYVRQIRGSVRMIGDGAVRWTMTSSHVNQTEPEWAMEGVQVGCIGSAVGVLGLWTGADHIRGDPIGPCWQWKVS